ncbi:septation protein IspZ [Idiomarina xiamenensis]|uniref:Inner membrane-spanning protein YciB n=1 Tax=Idiomarina xiamenensis 10-D-4 TaxID=740709 RepID=K2KCF1_9GAMM|nr:septation protein IspZ [Idiomarina xiamenensis]EKE84317.1 intracellular septation protein A [Idiomarina xiamenensis 10-D-4]
MALLLEYLPIVLFFVVYKTADIYMATATLMVATVLQLGAMKLLKHTITTRHWIVLAVVMAFGALTLVLHDDWFIKLKVSIIYLAIAMALAGALLLGKANPLKALLGQDIQLPDFAWKRLCYAWIVFTLALAAVNLYIAYYWTQAAWVNFKVFGILGITLVFTVATGFYMYKHHQADNADTGASS